MLRRPREAPERSGGTAVPGWPRRAMLALGLAGALLLIAAELTTVVRVEVGGAVVQRLSGGDRHSYALALLGVLAAVLAAGVARTASRPAMLAIAGAGLIAAAIVLIGDLSAVHSSGAFGSQYIDGRASAGPGFYLETLGAALTVMAGGGLLLLSDSYQASERRPDPAPRTASPDG